MGLMDFMRRLRIRPPSGERVELRPLEQVVLAYLIRSGAASTAAIQHQIDERGPVMRQQASEVLQAVMDQGLAEARLRPEDAAAGAFFVPTSKGLRLRGRLPERPTTVTEFWI